MFLKWKEEFESKGLKVNLKKTKVMVSGSKGEVRQSKVDPCATYGKREIENSVMCKKCSKWVLARCAKMRRVATTLAKGFVWKQCVKTIKEPDKETFFVQIKFVKSVCYLGDKLNASGGS